MHSYSCQEGSGNKKLYLSRFLEIKINIFKGKV